MKGNADTTVTKIDAARRQLRTAIRLFFEDADMVSVHTLLAAAHGILYDLSKAKGDSDFTVQGGIATVHRGSVLRDLPLGRLIKPEKEEEWLRTIRKAQNFFKHADREQSADAQIPFNPATTELLLFDALLLYHQVRGKGLREGLMYFVWFYAHDVELLVHEQANAIIRQMMEEIPDWDDKSLFLSILDKVPPNENYE